MESVGIRWHIMVLAEFKRIIAIYFMFYFIKIILPLHWPTNKKNLFIF